MTFGEDEFNEWYKHRNPDAEMEKEKNIFTVMD